MLNVLLSSVGRRSYLVEYFRQALGRRGRVLAANSHPDVLGLLHADQACLLPEAASPAYLPALLALCERHEVSLVCPCHDLEVLALARNRDALDARGICAAVPSAAWAARTLDKLRCGEAFRRAGVPVPWQTTSLAEARAALAAGTVSLPLLVKPRWGWASVGVQRCSGLEQVEAAHLLASRAGRPPTAAAPEDELAGGNALIQPWLAGREYCIQVINDLRGRPVTAFVAEIHAMRAGEADQASSLRDSALESLGLRIGALIGHRGPCDVDLMVHRGQPFVIDINPRFTGDYPFQHIAGANVPAALLAWQAGEPVDPGWLRPRPGVRGAKDMLPVLMPETHAGSVRCGAAFAPADGTS